MANKYWWPSGGTGSSTGNWSSTTNWSSSSASYVSTTAPTSADNANFGAYSGSSAFTVTVDASAVCSSFTANNANMTLAGTSAWTVNGSFTITALSAWSYSSTITFAGSTVGNIITTGGKTLGGATNLTINGTGTWTLGGALTFGSGTLTVIAGTFDTGGYNITGRRFWSTGSATRSVTLQNTLFTSDITTFWQFASTGLTFDAGTSTLTTTHANPTFAGGGLSYYTVSLGNGIGTITVTGANTFANFNVSTNAGIKTLVFPAGTTNTFTNFNVSGAAGKVYPLTSSTAGTQATLKKVSGTVSCDYLSIKDSNATGGATWNAGANSTNVSNNTGWVFTASPISGTLSIQLDDVAAALSGSVSHNGTASVQLGDIVPALTGSVGHAGNLALQLDDISIIMSGTDVHSGSFAIQLDDVDISANGKVTPPIPVSVITKGGITKRTKNYKNQREDVEKDVSKAINKILGIDDEPKRVIIEAEKKTPKRNHTQQIRELELESQINALGRTIDNYESALAQAELDDEEAILLLL